jgi:Protein of unknown function (DUF3489)
LQNSLAYLPELSDECDRYGNPVPKRGVKMTFTIDSENNLTVFGSPAEAANATAIPFDSFASEQELAELAAAWQAERLIAIWNSLPGVTPVKRFKDRKTAVGRIWTRIQGLGEPAVAEAKPGANPAPTKSRVARTKAKTTKKASPAKDAPKGKRAAKTPAGPRDGSKTATVVALLERAKGATLAELVEKMGWQAHTVRGFMAGAMKKAGFTVESFKSDRGERTYRINR